MWCHLFRRNWMRMRRQLPGELGVPEDNIARNMNGYEGKYIVFVYIQRLHNLIDQVTRWGVWTNINKKAQIHKFGENKFLTQINQLFSNPSTELLQWNTYFTHFDVTFQKMSTCYFFDKDFVPPTLDAYVHGSCSAMALFGS